MKEESQMLESWESKEYAEKKSKSVSETMRVIKKPYQKPSFRYEKVFETLALSCGKVNVIQQSCHSFRKAS
jgi:hypothetical protein